VVLRDGLIVPQGCRELTWASINICMKTFQSWLEQRRPPPVISEVDRLVALILAAGTAGISRADLSGIDLPREVIDELLASLLRLGMIRATGSGQSSVYRYCCRLA